MLCWSFCRAAVRSYRLARVGGAEVESAETPHTSLYGRKFVSYILFAFSGCSLIIAIS